MMRSSGWVAVLVGCAGLVLLILNALLLGRGPATSPTPSQQTRGGQGAAAPVSSRAAADTLASSFDNGLSVPSVVRIWLAEQPRARVEAFGALAATSPASNPNATGTLFAALLVPACTRVNSRAGLYMPVVAHLLWQQRPHLRQAFPQPCTNEAHRRGFMGWLAQNAVQEGFDARWLDYMGVMSKFAGQVEAPADYTVTVVGYMKGEFGIAESGRLTALALQQQEVATKILPLPAPAHSEQDTSASGFEEAAEPSMFNVIQVNADAIYPIINKNKDMLLPSGTARPINIGVWYWELPAFPLHKFPNCTTHVDEIWVASTHVFNALAPVSPVPVYQIDFPVPRVTDSTFEGSMLDIRQQLGIGERFIFFFNFDFLSSFERKNPQGVLDAFLQAFPPQQRQGSGGGSDGPVLLLKSINQHFSPAWVEQWEELQEQAHTHSNSVFFMSEVVRRQDMGALMHSIDCYVSLHRAEGLGLGLLDAMAHAKPVIATGYSGNADFTLAAHSYPVDYKLVELGQGWGTYEGNQTWAEPSVSHAAQLMRHVYTHPEEARSKGALAAAYVSERYSLARSGQQMLQRLTWLHQLASKRQHTAGSV